MPSTSEIINNFIANWASKEELYLKIGTASEINEADFTFKFTPLDEKSIVETVRMKSIVDGITEAFIIIPKEGSKVVVGFHSNTVAQCLIVEQSERVIIQTANKDVTVDNIYNIGCDDVRVTTESWVFNNGSFGGLIKINDLTTKINALVTELDNLKTALNAHTHPGVTTGAGITGPSSTAVPAFTQFDKDDYENEKIKH